MTLSDCESPDLLVIDMQSRRPKVRGGHVHGCPACYEKVPCSEVCSIEPDLTLDDGTLCGAYVTCAGCEPPFIKPPDDQETDR
jgi:hypothetical protein